MVYEIEKRSRFTSKKEFKKCERRVAKHGNFIATYVYKTFLFRKPEYLRIRISRGKSQAEVTMKIGTYRDTARKEINHPINLADIPAYVAKLRSQGFQKCAAIKTESRTYRMNNLVVAFNTIEKLGMIVEVEALTRDKIKIPILAKKVSKTMCGLGIKELDAKTYQRMINAMYSKLLKPVSNQKFTL